MISTSRRSTAVLTLMASSIVTTVVAAPSAQAEPGSVVVTEHATTDTVVDVGPKGDSVGDLLTFGNDVFDAADSQRVGTANGVCTRTVVGSEWDCGWTLALADGQIMVQGPFFDAADSVLAVTGGTGRYVGAQGEMDLTHLTPDGSRYRFTYRLA